MSIGPTPKDIEDMTERGKVWMAGYAEGVARYERIITQMVLHCPKCRFQHVDEPEPETGWENPPHRSHLCKACLTVWRPADCYTTGVASIATRGEHDTFP